MNKNVLAKVQPNMNTTVINKILRTFGFTHDIKGVVCRV